LVQQAIGVAGEALMLMHLPQSHEALVATGQRFLVFDGGGLLIMSISAFVLWHGDPSARPSRNDKCQLRGC
jgi:hypothetical protein